MNLYQYCHNNPVRWLDPSGLKSFNIPPESQSNTNSDVHVSSALSVAIKTQNLRMWFVTQGNIARWMDAIASQIPMGEIETWCYATNPYGDVRFFQPGVYEYLPSQEGPWTRYKMDIEGTSVFDRNGNIIWPTYQGLKKYPELRPGYE